MTANNKKIVIAIGGNAILKKGQKGTIEEQIENLKPCSKQILDLADNGYEIIIVHGNGPHVGNQLIKSNLASHVVSPNSLALCCAETQGYLGYIIQQSLLNLQQKREIKHRIISLITQVIVKKDDEAFNTKTKPIGPYYTKELAEVMKKQGECVIEDSNRGYRKAVSSPKPQTIVELDSIKDLIKSNIVIAGGGGGIPVILEDNNIKGIDAVIDKDYTASKIAEDINAGSLILVTAVKNVYINYGTDKQQKLDKVTFEQILKYQQEGHFAVGSMGPKIDAASSYVKNTGGTAIITDLEDIKASIAGKSGTHITKSSSEYNEEIIIKRDNYNIKYQYINSKGYYELSI